MSSVYHLGILGEVMLSTHLESFRISVCKMKVFHMKTELTRAPSRHEEHMSTLSMWSRQNARHMGSIWTMGNTCWTFGLGGVFVGICL